MNKYTCIWLGRTKIRVRHSPGTYQGEGGAWRDPRWWVTRPLPADAQRLDLGLDKCPRRRPVLP